ncbi:MAG TPA: phosphoglucomutase/phosphomannomutase family protein [Candidatus Melainabacteria bacterium]|nr:phosphoglucomutase/phosphomannomutase family protein [Candidatus Melainabacteria bacterium]
MAEVIKFGTDGWRAVIAEEITYANVERVAYAVGLYVRENYPAGTPLLIGYDTRFMADKFAERAGQVLMAMGVPVKVTSRDVPTPCIAWATQHETTAGALQFTASHNPPEYCGVKYIPEYAGPATDDISAKIVGNLSRTPAQIECSKEDVPHFDPQPPYLGSVANLINMKKIVSSGIKVGFDALYSTSRGYLDHILRQWGVPVKVLHDVRDPLFGGGMPEPKKQYLRDLSGLVKTEKLDVGLATDGDADRFAVIDEQGNYFSPNQLLCLLTMHMVKNRKEKGAIVRTVATTHFLDLLAKKYDLEVIETPVGFKFIGEEMRKRDILIGGEESGGMSFKGHIPEKDGIMANLLLVEMMAFEGKPLSQIWDDLQKEIGYELTYLRADMRLNDFTQKGLMKILTEKPLETLAGEKVTRVGRKDGLKLYLDDSNWLLIRPSGTEPLIRLYYEGTSSERTNKVAEDFAKQVEAIVSDLEKEADKAQDSQKSQKKDPTAKKSPAGPIETVGAKA